MVTRPAVPPYSSTTIGHVDVPRLHLAQQLVDRLGVRDEGRRPHDLLDAYGVLAVADLVGAPDQVLEVDDADDVVVVLADHRDPGEAAAQGQRQRLPQRLAALDEHHVGARHHHLADDGVAELEDRVDHLPLAGLDEVALLGQVDQVAQLRLGVERALAEAAAGGERVAEQDQQPRHRAEHPVERHRESGGGQADRVGVLQPDGAGGDADQDVGDHGHRGHGDEDGCPVRGEPVGAQDRGEDRGGELHDRAHEQQQVEVAGQVGGHLLQVPPAAPGVLARLVDLDAGDPGQGSLGGRHHTGQQDKDDRRDQQGEVAQAHGDSLQGPEAAPGCIFQAQQLGLQPEHLALLVGLGVVVAEQVQDAVGAQQVQLGLGGVPGLDRLLGGDLRAQHDVAEQRRSGLLLVVLRPRETSISSIGKASTSVGPGSSIHLTCSASMAATSTSRTDSSASGLTPIAAEHERRQPGQRRLVDRRRRTRWRPRWTRHPPARSGAGPGPAGRAGRPCRSAAS